MVRVAIVDDEREATLQLQQCLCDYEKECGAAFEIATFSSGDAFLEQYREGDFQVVFLDISMPGTDGYRTSQLLRERDENVVLIFVTNLAQYAIKGYEVGALDYVLKPIAYYSFKLKIKRALAAAHADALTMMSVTNETGFWMFRVSDLCYVEVADHTLLYHTRTETIRAGGTLKNVEKQLDGRLFFRCNYCYLINLRCVTSVQGNTVTVNGDRLQISRNRRKEFLQRLADLA